MGEGSERTDLRDTKERDQSGLWPCFDSEGKWSQVWNILLVWTIEC